MSDWIVEELSELEEQAGSTLRPILEKAFEEGIRYAMEPEGCVCFIIRDGKLFIEVSDEHQFAHREFNLEEKALEYATPDMVYDDEGAAKVRAIGALLVDIGRRLAEMPLPYEPLPAPAAPLEEH